MASRYGIALVALALLLLPGCGSDTTTPTGPPSRPTQDIAGPWTGVLTQLGLPPFRIAVVISPNGTGVVAYTGIRCGGKWTLDSSEGGAAPLYAFTERITSGAGGKCKGIGTVNLLDRGGPLLDYTFQGGGVASQGVLSRTRFEFLFPIFAQARLRKIPSSVADAGQPGAP